MEIFAKEKIEKIDIKRVDLKEREENALEIKREFSNEEANNGLISNEKEFTFTKLDSLNLFTADIDIYFRENTVNDNLKVILDFPDYSIDHFKIKKSVQTKHLNFSIEKNKDIFDFNIYYKKNKIIVYIPKSVKNIRIETSSGSVDFFNTKNDFTIGTRVSKSGDIELGSGGGNLNINTLAGNVKIKKVQCSIINCFSKFGDLQLCNIKADIMNAETFLGEIFAYALHSDFLKFRSEHGLLSLEGAKIKSLAEFFNNFKNIDLEKISAGTLKVVNKSGMIKINTVKCDKFVVNGNSSDLDIFYFESKICLIDSVSGFSRIEKGFVEQEFKANVEIGDLEVHNVFTGAAKILRKSGNLKVNDLKIRFDSAIENKSGDIKIKSNDENLKYLLNTVFGNIKIMKDKFENNSEREQEFGSGNIILHVNSLSGNIKII